MIKIVAKISAIVFVAEAAIMLALEMTEPHPPTYLAVLINVIALVVLSAPLIHLWVIKPFVDARDNAESELVYSEQKARLLLNSTAEAIYGLDYDGNCTFCNPSCVKMLGYDSAEELIGKVMHDLIHHTRPDGSPRPAADCPIHTTFRQGQKTHTDDDIMWRMDGTSFPVEYWSYPIQTGGEVVGTVVTFLDITERKEAEQDRLQIQKMDSLGSLAGGVAHDINNMLLPIFNLTSMVVRELPEDSPDRRRLGMVIKAAQRMKDMATRILAFSREEEGEASEIDIFAAYNEAVDLLRTTLPSAITIKDNLDPNVGKVRADAKQVEAVLMNLASNAADAMCGHTGKLSITLSSATLDEGRAVKVNNLKAGDYAKLTVADNGCGMDTETLKRIYEPFFTTKEEGKGTGLGMGMVFGTISKFGGTIDVFSELGKGTTFDVYLPLV